MVLTVFFSVASLVLGQFKQCHGKPGKCSANCLSSSLFVSFALLLVEKACSDSFCFACCSLWLSVWLQRQGLRRRRTADSRMDVMGAALGKHAGVMLQQLFFLGCGRGNW
jgi:hypothetical protein